MAHGDAREGKWRGNWRMEWVASTLHTTSEHGVSSITTADVHTSAASSRLNWRPRRFKWTRPFRLKTKYGFCACGVTFQTHITYLVLSTASRPTMRPIHLFIQWAWGSSFSLEVRWLVCGGNHCTLPRSNGKDAWSYTSISSYVFI